jgi:hypothetical protein
VIPEILSISYSDIYFIYFSRITRDVFTSSLSVLFSYLFMSVFFYFNHFAQCVCLFGMCVYVCVAMCVRERERHSGGLEGAVCLSVVPFQMTPCPLYGALQWP